MAPVRTAQRGGAGGESVTDGVADCRLRAEASEASLNTASAGLLHIESVGTGS